MQRIVRTVVLVLAGFVVLALGLDALVGASQPAFESGAEGVLRTFDADGTPHENRLVIVDDGGTLWIQSGHHFRGWYHPHTDGATSNSGVSPRSAMSDQG